MQTYTICKLLQDDFKQVKTLGVFPEYMAMVTDQSFCLPGPVSRVLEKNLSPIERQGGLGLGLGLG